MLSLYFPGGDLKAQFINARPHTAGISGREPTYTAGYIELIYTFYRLFVGIAPRRHDYRVGFGEHRPILRHVDAETRHRRYEPRFLAADQQVVARHAEPREVVAEHDARHRQMERADANW
ncbi:hypothetical protein WS71_01260 [Burkholderia mayonis]|uniref:Uncharacterized protein n=1 Tax=Burkholderia mayonis TaxID=1385591 RepID=A0A1B4FR28_9BURK|nr:hypothetical protein WS71_01260 [Burkholderia mayonis]KVE56825.1 hypothetical protein WS71_01990 [Burkholderia mayonis]